MKRPEIPANETKRLEKLKGFSILDTLVEKEYDDITYLASQICETPISLISLIDEKRQWFKSHHGIDATETPREYAFCAHAINDINEMLIVPDSRIDDRFHDNPLVINDPNVIFYAGIPLATNDGYSLGTLCVIDSEPKILDETQIQSLKILGNQVMKLLDLRASLNELSKKNNDIKESIEYAKKIQYSILPELKFVQKHLNQFTAFFEPKSVIGGDFYWHYKSGDINYIAVIDSTGHSVPGALMSIVIQSLMNKIMLENGCIATAEILGKLHMELYKHLQQEKGDEYSQDGCDLALFKIDYGQKKIQYSGAHQNAYILRGESTHVCKATTSSIGGVSIDGTPDPIRTYHTENIDLNEEMCIVMTTDGILDQLNTNDEIFGVKNLYKMMSNCIDLQYDEKLSVISKSVNQWKQGADQLDDMLLITFKLGI